MSVFEKSSFVREFFVSCVVEETVPLVFSREISESLNNSLF